MSDLALDRVTLSSITRPEAESNARTRAALQELFLGLSCLSKLFLLGMRLDPVFVNSVNHKRFGGSYFPFLHPFAKESASAPVGREEDLVSSTRSCVFEMIHISENMSPSTGWIDLLLSSPTGEPAYEQLTMASVCTPPSGGDQQSAQSTSSRSGYQSTSSTSPGEEAPWKTQHAAQPYFVEEEFLLQEEHLDHELPAAVLFFRRRHFPGYSIQSRVN